MALTIKMKFVIFVIVILLSLNIKAQEDLSGKSIVCGAIQPDFFDNKIKTARIEAFEFLTNNKLKNFFYSGKEDSIKLSNKQFNRDYYYETDLSRIIIYYEIGNREIINRETLEITYVSEKLTKVQFKQGDCRVVKSENVINEMKKTIIEIVNEIRGKNQL